MENKFDADGFTQFTRSQELSSRVKGLGQEIKSVESLNEVHFKQVMTYMRLSDLPIGLLINFNVKSLEDKVSLKRIINTFS